jgi:uncharacterized protein YndB with AHSA1/START domain
MADIHHTFEIFAPIRKVFDCLSTPQGLDEWWTKTSGGSPEAGNTYQLNFGPGYKWKARVTACKAPEHFELQMTEADKDWLNTKVGCRLDEKNDRTLVEFYHTGWPKGNDHWRISNYCWAMYLRIMKRYLEHGETVPYEKRLQA